MLPLLSEGKQFVLLEKKERIIKKFCIVFVLYLYFCIPVKGNSSSSVQILTEFLENWQK